MKKEYVEKINKLIKKRNVSKELLETLLKFEKKEDSDAQCLLGLIYFVGIKDEPDLKKAKYYWEKSAEKGNDKANNYLGLLYFNGYGVKEDYKKAIDYFIESANKGNVDALLNMGICYKRQLGVEQNYEDAVKCFKLAVSKGSKEALYYLALMYSEGQGVEQNNDKALDYFYQSYKNGNIEALVEIGQIFEEGTGLNSPNVNFAIKCYKEAAKRDSLWALYRLGIIYREGKVTEQDFSKSKMYIEKMAERKEPIAFFELGTIYQNGLGVEKNPEKAMELFEKWERNADDTYIKDIMDNLNGRKIKNATNISEIIETDIDENKYGAIRIIPPENPYCDSHTLYSIKDYKKVKRAIKEILEDIEDVNEAKTNELEVFMKIYVKLGKIISYDYETKNVKSILKKECFLSRNLMGGLLYGKSVCAGYAEILRNVLACKKIESKFVVSDTHGYNQVKIDGRWYYVDLTWDADDIVEGKKIENCLLSYENFKTKKNHINLGGAITESSLFDYPQDKILNTYYKVLEQYAQQNNGKEFLKMTIKEDEKEKISNIYRVASQKNSNSREDDVK